MARLAIVRSAFNVIQHQQNLGVILLNKKLPAVGCSAKKWNHRHFSSSVNVIQSPLGPHNKVPNEHLVEYIFKHTEGCVELPALTCATTGRSYTYGMLRMLINRCAQALLGHCGLKPKEVIGLLLPNIPEFAIICHGAIEAGLTVTFVNPLYTPDELKRQFVNAGVKMIVTIPQLLQVAQAIGPTLKGYRGTISIGGDDDPSKKTYSLQSLLMGGHTAELPSINNRDIAALPYSSGTTGLPKGVMLSHYNLMANMIQEHVEELDDAKTRSGDHHTVLTVLPFFHIYGFNGILNICLRNGQHIYTMPRFTPEDYVKALVQYKPSYLFVVPSLLLFLATHPAVTRDHLSSIECITSGAAPLTEGLLHKFKQKVQRDDIKIRQGYGMTETSPVSLFMPKLTPASKMVTIGIPVPGTEVKVVSLSTGEPLGSHQPGELLVRGPQVMVGYLDNEEATAEIIDKDGWLRTGDVAYYDEDKYFYIVDRCKELIKVKGNQVSPTELENILLDMPKVADVAVVGIPDSLAGEVPRAYIVPKENSKDLTESEILDFINPKVAAYKRLIGGVKFVHAIPRNASGKILRNELINEDK